MFLIAYLSFADRERIFSLISFIPAVRGFFEINLNKLDLFSFIGKYLEGFFAKFRIYIGKRTDPLILIYHILPLSNLK